MKASKTIGYILLAAVFLLLIFLAACEKAECKKDADCTKKHYKGECTDGKCVFAPLPGECGNDVCDDNEDKCSCSEDCGICQGKQGANLELTCIQNKCVPMVSSQKPVVMTNELSSAGDKFLITTNFPQPFNFKRDTFKVKISLALQSPYNSNVKVTRMFLSGLTEDRRNVNIAEKDVNKYIWGTGSEIEEELVLGFPTSAMDGTLNSLLLKINYEYTVSSASGKDQKTAVLQQRYTTLQFKFVNPDVVYPCPESCDDNNPGTQDICGEETAFLCQHKPVSNACGNFICESNENKCGCSQDCGICSGKAGTYVSYACSEANECLVNINPGVTFTPISLFDDRKLSLFHFQNNYKYNNPFNIRKDKFVMEMTLYELSPVVSKVKITTVRLLEGANEIASLEANKEFTAVGGRNTIEVSIPSIPLPEIEKSLTLGIWYAYTKDSQDSLGNFNKPLGKIVLISPDR